MQLAGKNAYNRVDEAGALSVGEILGPWSIVHMDLGWSSNHLDEYCMWLEGNDNTCPISQCKVEIEGWPSRFHLSCGCGSFV